MKSQLSREDWLEHGLKSLVSSGFGCLKAEPMAKALNVSRGSFYWHFKDIQSFRAELIALWRERATRQIIQEVEDEVNSGNRLVSLLHRAFTSAPDMEREIRAWALQDKKVATAVSAVDRERIGYIESLLLDGGVDRKDAQTRATFLYWAYIGQLTVSNFEKSSVGRVDLAQIERLLFGT